MSTLASFIACCGQRLSPRSDDDFIDRLHYFASKCLVPDMFPSAWEQYAEQYCWAQDTYYIPFDESVPRDTAERQDERISYYQWVPFFLLFQAFCFKFPNYMWKYLAEHSGIKIHDLVTIATDPDNVKSDIKTTNVKALTVHMQNAFRFHRRLHKRKVTPHRALRFLNLPYTGFYVTFVYLFVKACYLANVILQLHFMNRFLNISGKYKLYGFEALHDAIAGVEWMKSGLFPRVTLCDFQVRSMGNNVQNYSVQCMLVINLLNEKIFIFLWFWYVALSILTIASLVYWFLAMVLPCPSRIFVSRHLELSEMPFEPTESQNDVDRFVSSYLRTDGVFVLRMITNHTGVIFGTDLVLELWRSFYCIEETYRREISLTLSEKSNDENAKKEKHRFLRMRYVHPPAAINARGIAPGRDDGKGEILDARVPNGETVPFVLRSLDEVDAGNRAPMSAADKVPVVDNDLVEVVSEKSE